MVDTLIGKILCKEFQVVRKIGEGAFGEIYEGIYLKRRDEVAIKTEDISSKYKQLELEAKIYMWFHSESSVMAQAIPNVIFYCSESSKNILVMDLLGESLEDLFNYCNRQFSIKSVLMLADQMLKRVEYIHTRRIIHRDIKPDNFAIGRGRNEHRIYIFDFGLAKKFMSSTGVHISYKEGKSLTGTARYASINTHLGIEQSRRDDLESLGYVFMYFLRGQLPWQNLKAQTMKEKYEKIKEKKIITTIQELAKGLPEEFVKYIEYCRNLTFEEKPDYKYLRDLFKNLMKTLNYEYDYIFDWVQKKKEKFNQNPQNAAGGQQQAPNQQAGQQNNIKE